MEKETWIRVDTRDYAEIVDEHGIKVALVGTEKHANLITAAPDLLDACNAAKAILISQGIDANHRIVGEQFKIIESAILKATE